MTRSIPLCIVLSIITCGIYSLYWMVKMNDDMNILSNEPNDTSGVTVLIFSIITCGIYTWFWYYKMGSKFDRINMQRGLPTTNSSILYLLLGIFGLGIISMAIIQDNINKLSGQNY